MECANTSALNAYLRKLDKADEIDAMWEVSTKHLYEQLEKIAEEYRSIAMHFSDEYSADMDWQEDAKNAMGMV